MIIGKIIIKSTGWRECIEENNLYNRYGGYYE